MTVGLNVALKCCSCVENGNLVREWHYLVLTKKLVPKQELLLLIFQHLLLFLHFLYRVRLVRQQVPLLRLPFLQQRSSQLQLSLPLTCLQLLSSVLLLFLRLTSSLLLPFLQLLLFLLLLSLLLLSLRLLSLLLLFPRLLSLRLLAPLPL
jgi:hypothetical protein